MGEFAPAGSNAKMTPAQVRKYVADMKKAQEIAKKKLESAIKNGEIESEEMELEEIEKQLDNL
ncbi:MAG: hypothetical protein Q8K30_07005 [Candidatus Gracilibacteria bacterium]|nr:hypothetical protein [Candidatus Gracilibacteria bacterium]